MRPTPFWNGTVTIIISLPDDHSRSTKHLTPFATSEQRIRFKEVELASKDSTQTQPSSTSHSKFLTSSTPDTFAAISGTVQDPLSTRTSGRRGRPRGRGLTRGRGRRLGEDIEVDDSDPKGKGRATEEDNADEDNSADHDAPMEVDDTTVQDGPSNVPPPTWDHEVPHASNEDDDMHMIDPSLR